jgi:phage-related minor tail protein
LPGIRIVDYPWYDGCLRSLGGLLLERLQSWVDQSTTNKVNFLNVAAQRVATLIIAWYTAAKTIALNKVIATLIEVVATGIEVVATGIKIVATGIVSLVCAKDAFQETVPGLHLLPSSRI